ncbi:MAG TPA: hypothetical protein VH301_12665 [Usitatibacter sp.]|jgi:hypothetical protein|nr:hypothetical protein [Usitatibacter sp.]
MPKARSRRDANLRRHIAYVAARMMAEDGVADYGAAKMKAARQEGLADANLLPDNQEIEEALREYQGLYQKEEQPAQLRRLREVAVRVMRELEAFRPVLVGSVLSGTAGQHSDVNLQLFTDDAKAFSMYLVNKRWRFEEGSKRVRRGERMEDVPQLRIDVDEVTVTVTVLDPDDERSAPRGRGESQPALRARLAEVEALLAR